MTGHAHAAARPTLAGRLANRFRGHDDVPAPVAATRDDPGNATIEETVTASVSAAGEFGALAEALADPRSWWGITEMDFPPFRDRPYVPDPLGQFPPAVVPDPGPQADLGTCLIFRDTVRAMFVRQEEARGFHAPDVPWYERYAGLYRARTALPVIGCFGIADAAVQAHEEAKAAVESAVRGHIDRISACAGYEAEGQVAA